MAKANRVELDKAALTRLRRATKEQLRHTLERPLHDAAAPILARARTLAPVHPGAGVQLDPRARPGELRDSLRAETDEGRVARQGRIDVVVGTTALHALWTELGWMPRGPGQRQSWSERRAREAGQKQSGLRGVGAGKSVGQPFLRPAFDETKAVAREIGKRGIWQRIERLADK